MQFPIFLSRKTDKNGEAYWQGRTKSGTYRVTMFETKESTLDEKGISYVVNLRVPNKKNGRKMTNNNYRRRY